MKIDIRQDVKEFVLGLPFKVLLVGGAVRDAVFNELHGTKFSAKDFDFEFYSTVEEMKIQLEKAGARVSECGSAFPVIKASFGGLEVDFSMPRRESKTTSGHRGFDVVGDPLMTPTEAARRRDFTVNSLAYDIFSGEVIDPFGGVKDIQDRILRPTSEAFKEDPLRVLRAFQFAARFGMSWASELIEFARELKSEYFTLSKERVETEWLKWATKSVKPSLGLEFLKASGWIEFYPELSALIGVPQDAEWHPEGDVFEHTKHVVDAMRWQIDAAGITDENRIAALMFGALAHDFGKVPNTWLMPRGDSEDRIHWSQWSADQDVGADWRWRSPGHDVAGFDLAKSFCERIFHKSSPIVQFAARAAKMHMRHIGFSEKGQAQVKRVANEIDMFGLAMVVNADHNGRPFNPDFWVANEQMAAMLSMANEIGLMEDEPKPILLGRHVLEFFPKAKPGKRIGEILRMAFEAQLNDEFSDIASAMEWLKGVVY